MAERSGSDWTNGKDSESYQKRSEIIEEIICTESIDQLNQLRTILESGWDVNEVLNIYDEHKDEPLELLSYVITNSRINLLEIVQLLLEHGANPNVIHQIMNLHRTALHEAASLGYTDVVKMLLDAGAKCTTSDALQNPLALALQWDDCPTDLIELLLRHGAHPNDHDDQLANIPLLNAIRNCSYDKNGKIIVQLLLEHGANPNAAHKVNIGGYRGAKWVQRTALQEAASLGLTDVVKMLLDAGAKCITSDALLALALQNDDCTTDLIKLLLRHDADPNDHDPLENIPLFGAIAKCRYDKNYRVIVKLLLEHGANPTVTHRVNMEGYCEAKWIHRTALHEAARLGCTEVVKMLLDAGAECKTLNTIQNPLVLGLQNQHYPRDLIELLLKHGADPNHHDDQRQNIPLLDAIDKCRYYQNDPFIVQLLLEHGANPNVAHREDIGDKEAKWVQRTALHEAAMLGLTDVVKMLLDAGAKCTTSDALQNPLALALQNHSCPDELLELLLKHGADPNDHDDQFENIPLLNAIVNHRDDQNNTIIVKLLFEHGANPNVTYRVNIGYIEAKWVHRAALHEAASRGWTDGVKMLLDAGAKYMTSDILENPLVMALQNYDCPPDLIELLLKHGADVNCTVVGDRPLLHKLSQYTFRGDHMFLGQQLDLFFLHGGNVNMEDGVHTGLECTVGEGGHSNSVRWLIRHGADTSVKFTLLSQHFMQYRGGLFSETPLILLQAGMRVSHGAQTQLSNMEVAVSTWLQDDKVTDISTTIQGLWDQLEEVEEGEFQRMQFNLKKCTFPEYWIRQMADLQEFSDESLHVYPKDTYLSSIGDMQQKYQNMLDQIHRVLEFLSQPQSLQWYCRRCLRENLVSLQPSVVKTLPGPSRLKCYILCHEI